MIRLVALDIDGTLFDSKGQLPPANAEAIQQALGKGVVVTLATARAYSSVERLAGELGITAPVICHNGAMVRDGGDGTELLHLPMDLEAAREIVSFGYQRGYRLSTSINHVSYMRAELEQDTRNAPPGMRFATDTSFLTGAPTSILALGDEAAREIHDRFEPKYQGLISFTIAYTPAFLHYLVIINAQADKGKALLALCQNLGIAPSDTMAIGDTETDVSMIETAGLGLAMGNAPAIVQDKAKYVVPTCDEDGVAWAIKKYAL